MSVYVDCLFQDILYKINNKVYAAFLSNRNNNSSDELMVFKKENSHVTKYENYLGIKFRLETNPHLILNFENIFIEILFTENYSQIGFRNKNNEPILYDKKYFKEFTQKLIVEIAFRCSQFKTLYKNDKLKEFYQDFNVEESVYSVYTMFNTKPAYLGAHLRGLNLTDFKDNDMIKHYNEKEQPPVIITSKNVNLQSKSNKNINIKLKMVSAHTFETNTTMYCVYNIFINNKNTEIIKFKKIANSLTNKIFSIHSRSKYGRLTKEDKFNLDIRAKMLIKNRKKLVEFINNEVLMLQFKNLHEPNSLQNSIPMVNQVEEYSSTLEITLDRLFGSLKFYKLQKYSEEIDKHKTSPYYHYLEELSSKMKYQLDQNKDIINKIKKNILKYIQHTTTHNLAQNQHFIQNYNILFHKVINLFYHYNRNYKSIHKIVLGNRIDKKQQTPVYYPEHRTVQRKRIFGPKK